MYYFMCETVSWWQSNLSSAFNTAISTDTTDCGTAVSTTICTAEEISCGAVVEKRKGLLTATAVLPAKRSRHSTKSTTLVAETIEHIIVPKNHTQTHIGLFIL